jgi:hypothetical protein
MIYNGYTAIMHVAGGGSWNDLDSVAGSPVWWNICVHAICIIGIMALCVFVKKTEEREGDSVRKILGGFFKICGGLVSVIYGLWGFYLSMKIVGQVAGFWGFVIGFGVAPITFVVAPWYEGIVRNDWFPLVFSYGGAIIGGVFFWVGSLIAGD